MKKLVLVIAILGITALAGCMSSPVSTNQAKPVPPPRVFAPAAWLNPCPNCGTLIVKLDTATGRDLVTKIALQGKRVADMYAGEKITLWLPAGHYLLSASREYRGHDAVSEIDVSAGGKEIYELVWNGYNWHFRRAWINSFMLHPHVSGPVRGMLALLV